MDWLASALPIKPICRFLLNRYLGEILLEKVNLEQLSVDVLNGTGSIADVNLDVQVKKNVLFCLLINCNFFLIQIVLSI